MKTIYKNREVHFDVEKVDGKLLYYGWSWANPEVLVAEGGDTLVEMCENLTNQIFAYNSGEIIW